MDSFSGVELCQEIIMNRILVLIFIAMWMVSGCYAADNVSKAVAAPSGTSSQFHERNPRYAVRAGDSFDVNFELSPEYNQTVVVQPDGFVALKEIGDVHVAGLTVPELTGTLHEQYDKVLNQPLISVVLKDFEKPYFVADGQVLHPGKYELRGDVTLTQAIAEAGGFNDSAKHSQVLLFRHINDQWTSAQIINVKKMLKDGKLDEDVQLRPGDMLFVPKNAISKIRPYLPSTGVGGYASILH
jgi:polysaccharide export outer membrane protein